MAVNKVIYAGDTLIDLTGDSVTPETLAEGVTAHDASGEPIVGTMTGGGGSTENQLHGTLDGTITEIDSDVSKVIGYACRGLTDLTSVNLPNATSIGTYAFYGCDSIVTVNAPKVTSLGTYSFYGCSSLAEVNFPVASTVPNSGFYTCGNLTKADFGRAKSLGTYAFYSCSKLATLILRYTDGVVTLQSTSLTGTRIANYSSSRVYVPDDLVDAYKANSSWSTYASRIRGLSEMT